MFGCAAGRVEHGVGVEPRCRRARTSRAVAPPPSASMRSTCARDAEVDALLAHLGGDEVAHVVVEAAQDLLAAVELRDLRAEAVEDRRELAGDVAAADDDEAARERAAGRRSRSSVIAQLAARARRAATGQPPVATRMCSARWRSPSTSTSFGADDARAAAQQRRRRRSSSSWP